MIGRSESTFASASMSEAILTMSYAVALDVGVRISSADAFFSNVLASVSRIWISSSSAAILYVSGHSRLEAVHAVGFER
jgi:hypothetical protein